MSGRLVSSVQFSVTNTGLTGGAAGSAESILHDAARNLLFVLGPNGVDALNADTGALAFSLAKSLVQVPGGGASISLGNGNSIALSGNTLAVSFDGPTAGSNGAVALFDVATAGTGATWRATASVGAVPDMLVFTPDGSTILAAIEGEPSTGYAVDPAGGLALINATTGAQTFSAFRISILRLPRCGARVSSSPTGCPALPVHKHSPPWILSQNISPSPAIAPM